MSRTGYEHAQPLYGSMNQQQSAADCSGRRANTHFKSSDAVDCLARRRTVYWQGLDIVYVISKQHVEYRIECRMRIH